MIGKKLKKIADNLPLTSRELAKEMNVSTATLYSIYKKEHVDTKYLERFCEIAGIDFSQITGFSIEEKKQTEIVLEKQNEELKKENEELKKQNSFLSKEVQGIKKELSDMKDRFISFQEMAFQEIALYKKKLDVEVGKHKASSNKKATLSEEQRMMYKLNFSTER